MADIFMQLAGWVAVMAIWAFLPVAAWRTWRDYQQQRQARSRVIPITRLGVGFVAAHPMQQAA
jgi:hypothetical protein